MRWIYYIAIDHSKLHYRGSYCMSRDVLHLHFIYMLMFLLQYINVLIL